ncbi:MAG: response regulator transcription factor [Deltaproteobacteria bacterium]|nr:response regulator transcription factor [Deltaproteobacteria bacterium]
MSKTGTIRVGLVDDHAILREGLGIVLGNAADIELVGEAGSVSEARQAIGAWAADVVLLDLSLGDGHGSELLEIQGPRYVVLSMVDDPGTVARVLRGGAAGYVLKGRGSDRLLAAIRAAHRGETWLDEAIAGHVLRGFLGEATDPAPEADPLTPREREIVAFVAAGWTSREIAAELGVATKTVQNHRSNLLDKLGLRTTAALVRWALDRDLASPRRPPDDKR